MKAGQLPSGIGTRTPEPGYLYMPKVGEHAGHVMEFVSDKGVRFNILGEPMRSWLIRCTRCLSSHNIPPEDEA